MAQGWGCIGSVLGMYWLSVGDVLAQGWGWGDLVLGIWRLSVGDVTYQSSKEMLWISDGDVVGNMLRDGMAMLMVKLV